MRNFLLISLFLISCKAQQEAEVILKNVGDIAYDKSRDGTQFKTCNEDFIGQYFFTGRENDIRSVRFKIDSLFFSDYKNLNIKDETGFIRIRFIVNCKGQAGRFRMISGDELLNEKKFDKRITSQLFHIIKKIDFWATAKFDKSYHDYYYYLIFKIERGNLKEIV